MSNFSLLGTKTRPHDHIKEATTLYNSKKTHKDKVNKIRDIFGTKIDEKTHFGILICEFGQQSTNQQALNQECAIIHAIDIDNLTNVKREKFSLQWSEKVRKLNLFSDIHLYGFSSEILRIWTTFLLL